MEWLRRKTPQQKINYMATPIANKPTMQSPAPAVKPAAGKPQPSKTPAATLSPTKQVTQGAKLMETLSTQQEGQTAGSSDMTASEAPALGFLDENTPALPQGTYGFRPLTKGDMEELERCENIVREGMPKFLEVGQALLRIQQKKLWRMYCRSWKEYLEQRVGISGAYASMQTNAALAMENLLTTGEGIERPSTERQLRPLVGLSPENQVAAWKLAVAKAAGKKVTGKIVVEAVTQVLGDDALPQGWLDRMRHKLTVAGYETDFDQPVDLGDKTWVDVHHEASGTYVKLIDAPTLASLGTCYAMRDKGLKCQVVVDGQSVPKRKLEMARDGTATRLLDPVLSVFIHSLGAFVEYGDRLYEAGELGNDFKLALNPSQDEDANDLRLALEPPAQAEATEE